MFRYMKGCISKYLAMCICRYIVMVVSLNLLGHVIKIRPSIPVSWVTRTTHPYGQPRSLGGIEVGNKYMMLFVARRSGVRNLI